MTAAIVTGGARGIGRATAEAFAARGITVGIVDIDRAAVEAAAAEIGAEAIVADVADRAAYQAAIGAFAGRHGLSVLVNNAVFIRFGAIETMREDDIDRMLGVGVKGAFWGIQAALPHLRRAGNAAIVNVASAAAVQGTANFSAYTAVKGAIAALTRQLAVELGPAGVRVNAVAPGPIPTEGALADMADPTPWRNRTIAKTPLGRMGTAEEVAEAIVFLSSGASRWINGEVIVVDGGKAIAAHDRIPS